MCTLIGPFFSKHITFGLKSTGEISFLTLNSNSKLKKKTHLWFRKWHGEFGKFLPEHLEVSKLGIWWDHFVQSRKCIG